MGGIGGDGASRDFAVDEVTNALVTISQEHHEAHEGELYRAMMLSAAVADAGTVFIHFDTPAATVKIIHLKSLSLDSSGPKIKLELFEGGTVAANGTALVPINCNRVGTPPASALAAVMWHTPTTPVPAATMLDTIYIGGGTGNGGARNGAVSSTDIETILKASTKYFIKATNSGGAASDIFIKAVWYEEG